MQVVKKQELTVIDFFCGAGGFSEGFRQQGFRIVKGLDCWRPAVDSHNLNHKLKDEPHDILEFGDSMRGVEAIDKLPNTAVIVGSPPCVSFSMANKAGKADKSLGIQLIESFLRVVAVKKHQKGSILKAWYMENVPNSRNHVRRTYLFSDLDLSKWAREHGHKPSDVALNVQENGDVLCAADYGSPQTRQRFVCGEWTATDEFPAPIKTHEPSSYVTLGEIRGKLPRPNLRKGKVDLHADPNYPTHELPVSEIPDHFYDTGVYEVEWRSAKFAKVNHPFMGRMSFPENESRPSRTIMATRSASTREALMFKSERRRKGDGEYRLPTVREAASFMGFPLAYQFVGSEGTKWKQIGNAVCPHLSSALAKEIRSRLGENKKGKIPFGSLKAILQANRQGDLNTFDQREFDSPPRRKKDSKFRRHPFKKGNMTIALTNFHPALVPDGPVGTDWYAVAYLGSGKTYQVNVLNDNNRLAAWEVLKQKLSKTAFNKLKKRFAKGLLARVPSASQLQQCLADNVVASVGSQHPVDLVDDLAEFLLPYNFGEKPLSGVGHNLVGKLDIYPLQVLAVATICEYAKAASPIAWKQQPLDTMDLGPTPGVVFEPGQAASVEA